VGGVATIADWGVVPGGALLRYAAMTAARRAVPPALSLLLAGAVVACGGGSKPTGVATGPSQTPGFVTTAPPTPSASPAPTPTATPPPTPTPSPTPQPTSGGIIPGGDTNGAVDLGMYLYPSNTGLACGARTAHYDACPVTSRLAARLDQHPIAHAEQLCRCQNTWHQSTVTSTQTPDPTVWIVHVVLDFGAPPTVDIDLRVLRTDNGWLADDTTCTGLGEDTSIYAQNPPSCFAA
jgi:hypothetical protein